MPHDRYFGPRAIDWAMGAVVVAGYAAFGAFLGVRDHLQRRRALRRWQNDLSSQERRPK